MAKKGGSELVALICSVCKSQNYVTYRNKVNMEEKLQLKKYCNTCEKYQIHKESSKLD